MLAACTVSFLLGVGTAVVADGNGATPEAMAAAPASATTEVARFSGTGPQETTEFTVDRPWELHWQSDSDVSISVYRTSQGVRTGVPSQLAGDSGWSVQPDPGAYRLEVMATGEWTVTVKQPA